MPTNFGPKHVVREQQVMKNVAGLKAYIQSLRGEARVISCGPLACSMLLFTALPQKYMLHLPSCRIAQAAAVCSA